MRQAAGGSAEMLRARQQRREDAAVAVRRPYARQLGLHFLGQRRPLRTGEATYAQVVTSGRSTSRCSTVISPGQKSFRRFATSFAMTTER